MALKSKRTSGDAENIRDRLTEKLWRDSMLLLRSVNTTDENNIYFFYLECQMMSSSGQTSHFDWGSHNFPVPDVPIGIYVLNH